MIGKCGYNYMKESLLIMHTRSKIQTSQNLIFKYLGISTTYTPQIVLFLGAKCAPTIRHLAYIKVQHWNNHTTHRPTSSTTHHHHTISYTMIAMLLLLLIICDAACCMPHVTCYNIGKCHIMAKGVGAATADATWGEAWCTNGGSRKNELVGVSAPFYPRG